MSPASAQETKAELEVDYPDWPYLFIEVPKALRNRTEELKLRFLVAAILRADSDPERRLQGVNETKFDAYYQDIMFRRWTHPDQLAKIVEDRVDLLRQLRGSKSPQAHDRLNNLISRVMPKFAEGNYHPALRYNAVLLLGELNSKEASTLGTKAPAVPWLAMLPVLIEHATKSDQIDAVRVAALLGIRRHAEVPLPDTVRDQIIDRLMPILSSKPPEGRTPEGHAWMQRQVIDILAVLGSPGARGVVTEQLRNILADTNQPMSLRCAAAAAVGSLRYGATPPFDPKEVAGEMGAVGVEASQDEITWLQEGIEKRLEQLNMGGETGGTRIGPAMEGEGGLGAALLDAAGGEADVDAEGTTDPVLKRLDTLARRRLKSRLNAVRSGLGGRDGDPPGIQALARSGPANIEVTRLANNLDGVMTVLEDTELNPEQLLKQIDDEAKKLEAQVVKMGVVKKTAPATGTGPDEPDGPTAGGDGPPAADGPGALDEPF